MNCPAPMNGYATCQCYAHWCNQRDMAVADLLGGARRSEAPLPISCFNRASDYESVAVFSETRVPMGSPLTTRPILPIFL